jgi:hypothetical protein
MKILRSVNRRGFSVGKAGWFTVLLPNTWFPASRLNESVRHRRYQPGEATGSLRSSPATLSLNVKLNTNDPGPMQLALTVLGAMAITSALLWWIITS